MSLKITPNVDYNCGCKKLKNIDNEELPALPLSKPKQKSTQIISLYKSKKDKNKNKTLF